MDTDATLFCDDAELLDLVAALDLACVALYVVCALEHTVRLGDLVVDNLLYQVAKKYAEIPAVGVLELVLGRVLLSDVL
ncbi:unnamed protein product [Phytophthora lilii]|uniref:Unnamed protein product n=1 Tax=Phytophthora lilii TaxID=2077276 RepID=A0A9W6X3L6_9STRA|nr:unnamed protein product [Phytophthora lilii]